MWAASRSDGSFHSVFPDKESGWDSPVLVRHFHSRKQAAQLARFANLTWEEKVERVAKAICDHSRNWVGAWDNDTPESPGKDGYRMDSRAVLISLGEQPGKGEGESK